MRFKLVKQNLYKVGEDVFGYYTDSNGFLYNRTYKYWYRSINNVIQFLGLSKYSGGEHDIGFCCTPYAVPIGTSVIEEKRGKIPVLFEDGDTSIILARMEKMGMYSSPYLNAIRFAQRYSRDPGIDLIKEEMRNQFDTVTKPALENAVDSLGCYELCIRLKEIALKYMRMNADSANDPATKAYKKAHIEFTALSATLIEIYSLLDMQNYALATERLKEDEWARNKVGATLWPFRKLKVLVDRNDTEEIQRLLKMNETRTKEMLKEHGFKLDQ